MHAGGPALRLTAERPLPVLPPPPPPPAARQRLRWALRRSCSSPGSATCTRNRPGRCTGARHVRAARRGCQRCRWQKQRAAGQCSACSWCGTLFTTVYTTQPRATSPKGPPQVGAQLAAPHALASLPPLQGLAPPLARNPRPGPCAGAGVVGSLPRPLDFNAFQGQTEYLLAVQASNFWALIFAGSRWRRLPATGRRAGCLPGRPRLGSCRMHACLSAGRGGHPPNSLCRRCTSSCRPPG